MKSLSQTRIASLSFFALLSLAVAVVPAAADDTLYDNGAYNGEVNAWQIGNGITVSDSFTLGKAAQIKAISFVAWVIPGDTISEVDGSFSDTENGLAGATYSTTKSNIKTPSIIGTNEYGYEVELVTLTGLDINLNAGTYWLNINTALTDQGDPIFWDENSGPSMASQSAVGTIPSESFTLQGSNGGGSTPEPSSLALFGSGVLGIGGLLRRRFLG
jgi:PEP-CTERM motif